MNWLIDALVYKLWWPLQVGGLAFMLAVLFLLAVRIFGWERVRPWVLKLWLPLAILLAAFGLTRKAQQQGYTDRRAEEEKALDHAEDLVDEKRTDIANDSDAQSNERFERW